MTSQLLAGRNRARLAAGALAIASFGFGWFTFPSARAAGLETPVASRWALDINTASYHTRSWARDSLNQDNPGLGVQYQYSPNLGLAGGAYENSYSRTSLYALAFYTPAHFALPFGLTASAGIAAGSVSGYTRAEAPGRPGALLEVRSAAGYGVNLVAVPNAGQSAGFVGLQLVVPLA